jgi:NADH-quinone oxidoreductase subunit N
MSVWVALSPLLATVATAIAVMLADALGSSPRADERAPGRTGGDLGLLTAVGLFASAGLALGVWSSSAQIVLPAQLQGLVAVDRFTLYFCMAMSGAGGLAALVAGGYLAEHRIERGEYYALLALSVTGAILMAMATDFLVLFVGLETMSLAVYSLVGFRRTSRKSLEAAMKYFLLGSFAAAILLFGVALLYVLAASTQFGPINEALKGEAIHSPLALLGMVMVLIGLGFKVSAVPFHMWTPDAYEGAPTPTTAFMSVVVKAAAFASLLRVLLACFGETGLGHPSAWPQIVAFFAVASMILGNVVALLQRNVKRMLAYSSIAHAGYLLVGVLAAWRDSPDGRASVLFYLASYAVTNIGAFAAIVYLGRRGAESVHLEDFAGAARRHPTAALALTLFLVSLTGMPPTSGFFAKLYVLRAALDRGMWAMVLVAVLTSAVSAYYYVGLVVQMYMKTPAPGQPVAQRMNSGLVAVAIVLCASAVLAFGIWPSRLLSLALEATW